MTENVLTEFPNAVREPSLFITRGAPASGKSTAAKLFRCEDPGNRVIVEKDKIREMLAGEFVKENEHLVHQTAIALVDTWLGAGRTVIVSDTNLPNRSVKAFAELALKHDRHWYVVDFTNVPLEVLHRRNQSRRMNYETLAVPDDKDVPDAVIDDMYNRFIKGRGYPLPLPEVSKPRNAWEPVVYDPVVAYEPAIIVDIDGTLAKMNGRSPYDWSRVFEDRLNPNVVSYVQDIGYDNETLKAWGFSNTPTTIILMSGRDEVCREETERWLNFHEIPFDHLYMRPEGDTRKDDVVKYELFNDFVRDRYRVRFVLDDRDQVVAMWRAIGLECWQVAAGNF